MRTKTVAKKTFTDIDDYIAAQPREVRQGLNELRNLVRKAAPKAEEVISYGMPGFRLQGSSLCWFAAHKNHYGFYPGVIPSVFKDRLSAYKTSKGAIQFPISKPLPKKLITDIVQFRAKQNPAHPRKRKK